MERTIQNTVELDNLLFAQWRGDRKMVEHCTSNCRYVSVDDMFVEVCSKSPSITKTIWFDDTRSDPGAGWETFLALNTRNNMAREFELSRSQWGDFTHLYFCVHYYNDRTNGRLAGLQYKTEEDKQDVIRLVTAEELTVINEAIREENAKYSKRLESYFRRYGKHVRSEGYWADR